MRHRRWRFGVLLLVAALIVGGLTGCERRAESREPVDGGVTGSESPPAASGSGEASPTAEGVIAPVATPAVGIEETAAAIVEDALPEPEATVEADEVPTPVPAAADTQPSTDTGNTVRHTVQRGETLSQIAAQYGTSVSAIVKLNGLQNKNQIVAGQKLKIPGSGSSSGSTGGTTSGCSHRHKVRSGEWVWQIARDYGVSPYDILSANGLTIQSGNNIQPGKVLCIP